jgi:hypothetical protein
MKLLNKPASTRAQEYVVHRPISGQTHRFDREDKALGFAADLAVLYAVMPGDRPVIDREVRVEYPSGAVVGVAARIIQEAP